MATWNPSDKASTVTLSGSNLVGGATSSSWGAVRATEAKSTGKWYFEVQVSQLTADGFRAGIATSGADINNYAGASSVGWDYGSDGTAKTNGSTTWSDISLVVTDTLMVALDADAKKVWFGKDGFWLNTGGGSPTTGTGEAYTVTGTSWYPVLSVKASGGPGASSGTANFGATTTAFTPPLGYTVWDGAAANALLMDVTEAQDTFDGTGGTIAQDERIYVVCGGIYIYKSNDGTSWTQVSHDIVTLNAFRAIAQDENTQRWVIVGNNGTIWTSDDGMLTWTSRTSPTATSFTNLAWGGGRFVALAGVLIVHSADGETWTSVGAGATMTGVAFNGSTWAAVGGNGRLYYSADGATWSLRANPIVGASYADVAWNGSQFLAVTTQTYGGTVTSPTGLTWTRRTDVAAGTTFTTVIGAPGRSHVTRGTTVRTSINNGSSWSSQSRSGGGGGVGNAAACDGDVWLEVGNYQDGSANAALFRSVDGINWSLVTIPRALSDFGGNAVSGVAYGIGDATGYAYGTLAATEASDTFVGTATFEATYEANLAVTEAQDVLAFTGVSLGLATATFAATEAQDTIAVTMTKVIDPAFGTLAVTEAVDTLLFTGQKMIPSIILQFETTDPPDVTTFRLSTTVVGNLAATETQDALLFVQGGGDITLPIQVLPATFDNIVTYGASLFDGGTLNIYSGAQPELPSSPASGTLLGEIELPDPAFTEAEDGTATKAGDWESAAIATGVAGWFRMLSADGTQVIDGSVSTPIGTGNMLMNTTSVTVGDPLVVEVAIFEFQLLDEL